MDCTVHGILQARILEWVAFPFPGDFATQGLNPGLLYCRQILYQLSHKGSFCASFGFSPCAFFVYLTYMQSAHKKCQPG